MIPLKNDSKSAWVQSREVRMQNCFLVVDLMGWIACLDFNDSSGALCFTSQQINMRLMFLVLVVTTHYLFFHIFIRKFDKCPCYSFGVT